MGSQGVTAQEIATAMNPPFLREITKMTKTIPESIHCAVSYLQHANKGTLVQQIMPALGIHAPIPRITRHGRVSKEQRYRHLYPPVFFLVIR
jgi:hypothetical protein